ncbi:acryloyl-CoA reductase [Mycobacterium paraseoulense]|uniref:Oxidoreductase n=1 Tax=Mycobacterium paraseoulense TaxID=590652 RepID=A0A1X0IFB5_9MYCO|nr:acryloyl-CoA reductase [Mycobacterium paraseoulense]MCV7393833.1 acryloyl-CoA reductase [Mycobacterium paraseoulense]ORB45585.1 oxidoreductase [Mycobacterium paraseoulense]BBZ70546.1 alcohol dehydrogenase [Mycobacterium paraseoulense]
MTKSFSALTATREGGRVLRRLERLTADDLPADGVLIDVQYSSVNYKDGLATIPNGQVAAISPLIPGIDLAGAVVESSDDRFRAGDLVLAHGYGIGTARHGGYAGQARVPADWLVALPEGLSPRDAMVIGTAGFTAAISVVALEEHGITPDSGPVVVTGASGGVGSCAVAILADRGYAVTATTGKASSEALLRQLGAVEVLGRDRFGRDADKPLRRPRWAGAVDCVGGTTLANVLSEMDLGGVVLASGLTGGFNLPTTVFPFIMRGVTLAGMDSVQLDIERRRNIWARLATDLRPARLDAISAPEIALEELEGALDAILAGDVSGRVVVRCQA